MSYSIQSQAIGKSGLSAAQIDGLLAGTGMAGLGQSFIDCENQYNINALFAVCHGAIESAWGNSYYARTRNALFGINAYDSNPDASTGYPSKRDSVLGYGQFLHNYYVTPGAPYFSGTTISAIFVHYSTSGQVEAQNIVNIMNNELTKLGQAPSPVPTPAPSGGPTHVVLPGENLSLIAQANGLSLAQLEALNPQLGPSAGRDFNKIFAGDVVYVKGQAPSPAPTPTPAPAGGKTYTVVGGDNLSTIAQRNGLSLADIENLNPQLGPTHGRSFDKIFAGDVVNLGGGSAPAPAPAQRTYTVQANDNLSNIASKFPGTTWQSIYNANKGVIGGNPDLIKAGQVLVIQ